MALLELRGITRDFPGVRALDGVDLDLERGRIHALCGENGAGKSTLIKILSGYSPAGTYEGEIRLRGETVRFSGVADAERRGIAVIAQELALVPELSVAENLMLGREPVRRGFIRWTRLRAAAQDALARVGADFGVERPVRSLGVGQQQLVEIARALDKRSEILVLDEPTASLTERDARRLLALLRELAAKGVASLYVSHRLEEVFSVADRITVLRDGRAVASAPAAEWTPARVVAAMVGRPVSTLYPRPAPPLGGEAFSVEGWRVADPDRPGRFAVDGVSFAVRAGEILGIGGLMGSGRTALAASLFGAARSRVLGSLAIAGGERRPPFRAPSEAIAAGVALVSEDRKRYGLVAGASVLENLTLPTLGSYVRRGFLDDGARAEASRRQVEALSIRTPSLGARAADLSGGTQQKVVLGKWLLAKPRILLLDEPTRGIDVGGKAEIHGIVCRLAAEGAAIVLVSSDLPELLALSHRVLVLKQGRPAARLEGSAATPESVVAAATGSA
ncbi:MAG TPA: sugar ABC transporter ATP-binding protein [Thermoanaerobaculia bacterium]